jgi:hypothetical protein
MKTALIVLGSVIGALTLIVGGLVFLWFYQGGCCIRRLRNKVNRKTFVRPIVKPVIKPE